MFAFRFKRWLLRERIEQLHSSYEPGGMEHQQPQGGYVVEQTMTQEPVVAARVVIRPAENPLLSHYGTPYALFDEWIAACECVLMSDAYRLGDHVWVSGPPSDVIEGRPVMKVAHPQLLRMKWVR